MTITPPRNATGVEVPPELAALVGQLLGYGIEVLAARNGTLPSVPALDGLRAQLQVTAASACGRPRRILATPVTPVRQLTVDEAARVSGLSPRQVRRLAHDGTLIARKAGRDWQIDEDSANRYGRRRTWQQRAA
ncbi:excisionase family DNA binding protein [Kitasatospora sp. GP30]|uniref:helix-turn-helix domain-containing protein n=1 Tax=Kitasatospora sp. GP30 TaxID=3035084 RepID=UPI000C70A2F8|nr:helix-turn-helix domain-containing protein [Kitasatospora sp. GP30]MDH6141024.1 excisionase family DNA binding protein [Kitasatospora sp. GP30]